MKPLPEDQQPVPSNLGVRVEVPEDGIRFGPVDRIIWDETGALLERACRMVGRDQAYSLVISRLSRELRRAVGLAEAQKLFRDVAETMPEASKGDR